MPIHCPKKSPVKPSEGPHRHYWSQEVLVIHQTEGAGCRWIMMEISWCCGCSGFQRLVARSFLGWWMMVTFNHIWAELWLPDSFNFESMNDLYRTGPVKVMMPNENLCNRYFTDKPGWQDWTFELPATTWGYRCCLICRESTLPSCPVARRDDWITIRENAEQHRDKSNLKTLGTTWNNRCWMILWQFGIRF